MPETDRFTAGPFAAEFKWHCEKCQREQSNHSVKITENGELIADFWGPGWEAKMLRADVMAASANACFSLNPTNPSAVAAEIGTVFNAARALIEDVRSRYPGEELRCPHMIVLDMALQRIHSQSKGGGDG